MARARAPSRTTGYRQEVAEVTLTNEMVRGKLRPADAKDASVQQPFVAIRVGEADLVRELEAQNVKFMGTIQSSWLRDLFIIWILPILVWTS